MVLFVQIPADPSQPPTTQTIPPTAAPRNDDLLPSYLRQIHTSPVVIDTAVLIRPAPHSPGLYAHTALAPSSSPPPPPNVRATRLAMACGLHSRRLFGDVSLGRWGYQGNVDVSLAEVEGALRTPDVRKDMMSAAPRWLGDGAQRNYHDGESLRALVVAMTRPDEAENSQEEEEDPEDSDDEDDHVAERSEEETLRGNDVTLCLHCRRPASALCRECRGAYFCPPPRRCRIDGWSHRCLCPTWKVYVERRRQLSDFSYFSGWQQPLLREDCREAEDAYRTFLMETIRVVENDDDHHNGGEGDAATTAAAPATGTHTHASWWNTELHGWNGGKGRSAQRVDLFRRVSYAEGLKLDPSLLPPETRPSSADVAADERRWPLLTSWEDYYRLRSLPPSSPVALLATFPLTVYYAIQRYGKVPVAVSHMLDRPMRVHAVGIEKELNFVDFFKEVGFLLPEHVRVDMTWIVREDMFPESVGRDGSTVLSLRLTSNLSLNVVGGTYGESLDPNFDIVGGAPDMVIGLNAGLYAYESWRHVVSYLYRHPSVVGVFTDYNEHSGVNCASLGGARARDSLEINPFRQPRAMSVNCMNLPQMSNAFMYVFNEQELE